MTFAYIAIPIAGAVGTIIGEHNRFAGLCFILALLFVLGQWVDFMVTGGYELIETGEVAKKSKTRASGKEMIQAFIKNPHAICLVTSDFPRALVRFVQTGTGAYYFLYVANNMALFPRYIFLNGLGALMGAFLAGHIAKKVEARTMALSCYTAIIVLLIASYFNYLSPHAVIGLIFCVSIFNGCAGSVVVGLYTDAAVYSQWKTGADSRGLIMGLIQIPTKVAKVVSSVVINVILITVGFNAAAIRAGTQEVTPTLQRGITGAFTLLPAILLVFSLLLILFGFKLTKAKVLQYQEEIKERQARQA
jgi:GPH family glycoside/pentoside/hexuronide:cation symporter